jgi:hypothetical protein
LEQLQHQNIRTQGYRFADSTRKNYLSYLRSWFFFAIFFELCVMPASEESLCCFMELMAVTSGFEHCKNTLGGIKYAHAALGFSFPSSSFSLDCTMQGLKRRLARTPFQVLPIDPKVLKLMYKKIDIRKYEDLALWCSFLVAFFCLFRKANTVPKDSNFDVSKILTRGNIGLDIEKKTVYIYCGFSKTNQYRKKDMCIPIPCNDDPCLDLYRHMSLLLKRVQAPPHAPAFTYSKGRFINYNQFTTRLKTVLGKAGLNPDLFSGHSFRRGGASFLFSVGATQLMVQVLGGWSSMVYTRYLYMSEQDRLDAQLLMANAINAM